MLTKTYLIVVINAFKTAVTYEQMREENDARVAIVFLAQADLMSFFLTYASSLGNG